MRKLIDAAYERTEKILTDHMDQLHTVANYLYDHEKIEADEFKALMEGKLIAGTNAEFLPDEKNPGEQTQHTTSAADSVENKETPVQEETADSQPQSDIPSPEIPQPCLLYTSFVGCGCRDHLYAAFSEVHPSALGIYGGTALRYPARGFDGVSAAGAHYRYRGADCLV